MRGKGMSQAVAVGTLHDACRVHRSFECALQYSFGNMVPLLPVRARIDGKTRGRKNILPRPFARRVRELSRESERKMDTAKSIFEILFVLCFDSHQMTPQRFTHIQR